MDGLAIVAATEVVQADETTEDAETMGAFDVEDPPKAGLCYTQEIKTHTEIT